MNWALCCISLTSALRRQRHVDLCEFKASLVYKVKFQASQGYIERPCHKTKLFFFKCTL